MIFSTDNVIIIAKFLRHLYKYSHVRWVPIINYETGNLHGHECLSHVMVLNYDSLYLPLSCTQAYFM
jgi:hypothetical protein